MPSGQGRQARLPFLARRARARSLALFFPATDTADYSALNPCWPVETGGAEAASLRIQTEATPSHQIAHFFALANAASAITAAAVRFSTFSLAKMCSTCLQIVPVHAIRITPIS